jgi:hypothetical protein
MREITIDESTLHYRCTLQLAGVLCSVRTNCSELTRALEFRSKDNIPANTRVVSIRVFVQRKTGYRHSRPHFRGLHHLVVASFSEQDVFVFDLSRRIVTATVSEDTASDAAFWNDVLLPIAIGVLGAAVGVLAVHCACLSIDGRGLLIAGPSGAGKSSLSLALARQGFDYLSDDWTYLSAHRQTLIAHGMGAAVKLLPDAVRHFPQLADYPLQVALNGELAYEMPANHLGTKVEVACTPSCFVFLERSPTEGWSFSSLDPEQARCYVESSVEPLPVELDGISRQRTALIQKITQLPCWAFRYGGPPQIAAEQLRLFMCGKETSA